MAIRVTKERRATNSMEPNSIPDRVRTKIPIVPQSVPAIRIEQTAKSFMKGFLSHISVGPIDRVIFIIIA